MNKQEELLHRCEKLMKVSKRAGNASANKPRRCKHCIYHRPDFKYRRCQFSRGQFSQQNEVFRKNPLKYDKFSGKEVVRMNV